MFVKTFWTFWCTLSVTFIADLIIEFLLLIGVKHCLTLAYSKEENAIVERYNIETNRHFLALTYDNSSLTDDKKSLPFVQRILNSNHSDRLKISAAQMLFGNMLKIKAYSSFSKRVRYRLDRCHFLLVRCSLCKIIYLKNLLQNYYALIYYICQLRSLILTKINCWDLLS